MNSYQTAALRGAYLQAPQRFQDRIEAFAASLLQDGYQVKPGDQLGVFHLLTPKGATLCVDLPRRDCACRYQQSGAVPEVPCKHLQGLAWLIEQTLLQRQRLSPADDLAPSRERSRLEDHWRAFEDAAMDALCAAYEQEQDARLLAETCFLSAELNRMGVAF